MTDARPSSSLRLIGVDVATQPKSVGVARALLKEGALTLECVTGASTWEQLDEVLGRWLQPPALFALDAPLGWPRPLSEALHLHEAGASLPPVANALFRRETDDVVARELGKRPLDVGADRIARTAHTALRLLHRMREVTVEPIPLAWRPGQAEGLSAIEVYPAGTLAGRGLPRSGYKGAGSDATQVRARILDGLRSEVGFDAESEDAMHQSDHLLDAALCCLAAADFASGRVLEPEDLGRARREGWIWVSTGTES